MTRTKTYFVADVHLGLKAGNPSEREDRFVQWLRSIRTAETKSLWLLGDIWDFWYEYRDVVPREGARVVSELIQMVAEGIEVNFIPGNHDIWCYSFFESLGIRKLQQPQVADIDGKSFLLGHGDALGGAKLGYRLMLRIFHSRVCQVLFNQLHPWIAFRFGTDWSNSNRRKHGGYKFKGESEPLYQFCAGYSRQAPDFCIFGHFHDQYDAVLPTGSRLIVLKDWIAGGVHYACWDGEDLFVV
ncbi:MAG: UDP-2,3-diacylglucosamine diphosphatase [Bacteroidales bacterium]|nr:UDP-2,3-diacylglucosamine diphosphatase [Bacteroidales bacterium]